MGKEALESLRIALSLMFKINRISGIAPLSFERTDRSKKITTILVRLNYAVYTFLASSSVLSIIIIASTSYISYFYEQGLSGSIKFLWPIFYGGTGAVSGYSHLFRHLEVRKVFRYLLRFDAFSAKLSEPELLRVRISLYFQTVLFFGAVFNSGIFLWRMCTSPYTVSFHTSITPILIFWNLIVFEQTWQFQGAVILLRLHVERFISRIRYLGSYCIEHENFNSSSIAKKYVPAAIDAMKLHLKLHRIFKSIISVYSLPVLLTTVGNVFNITFSVYSIVDVTMYSPNGESSEWHDNITESCSLGWVLTTAATLFQGVFSCLKLANELHLISLQLLHTKFHFSAFGLMPLDFTLFTSMAGAMLTYVIILVQFHDHESSTKKKLTCNC